MNKTPLPDYVQLHLVVILLGFTAILGKLVTLPTVSLVFYRCLISAIALFFFLQKKIQKPNGSELKQLLFLGVILAAHWLCFFGSAKLATASLSLVAFSTTSFFTSLIEPLFFKRRVNKLELALGLVVILAISLIFQFEQKHTLAIVIGLIGASLASVFSVWNGKLSKTCHPRWITFVELATAAVVIFPLLFTSRGFLQVPNYKDIIWVLTLALGCTLWPYLKMMELLRRISPFTLNLSINMEPIYGILLALLIFGDTEKMSSGFYFGGFLIMATILVHAWAKKNSRKESF